MTGIYILKTLEEYRVTYSNLFIELMGTYNRKTMDYEVVPEIAEKMFGDSKVFDSYDLAIDYAKELSRTVPETDDGIFVISDFYKVTFEDLINGNKYS
jgi:hypothetical protein